MSFLCFPFFTANRECHEGDKGRRARRGQRCIKFLPVYFSIDDNAARERGKHNNEVWRILVSKSCHGHVAGGLHVLLTFV